MNSQNDQNKSLQRRQQELEEREQAIRLRELEAELYRKEPPLYQTVSQDSQEKRESLLKQWQRKLGRVAKFAALILVVIASYKIAVQLAGIIIVGTIAFVSYKLFLESDKSDK
ncbi:DUF3040 domain-containing protein [Lyngbya aestuarii]|uniref:DUF3040 domain-containing protein n=1 Tax=Lyngbya aestuarii TaxID=118322 RepID=UPI00403DB1F9